MKIRHFTSERNLPKILKDGYIQLEGTNFPAMGMPGNEMFEQYGISRGKIPQLVWFTKANNCKTADGTGYIVSVNPFIRKSFDEANAFEVNAEDINAIPWRKFRNKFSYHKKTMKFVEMLEWSAKFGGDDIDDYYVVDQPVDINKCELVKVKLT